MKKPYIYTVHAMEYTLPQKGKHRHNRTFGWFTKEKEAKDFVRRYPHWLRECLYEYIVIEKFPPGIHCTAEKEWWYKWNQKTQRFNVINKPEELCKPCQVVSFGLG